MLGRPNGVMESQSLISSFHTESFKIHCERAVNRVEREREREDTDIFQLIQLRFLVFSLSWSYKNLTKARRRL